MGGGGGLPAKYRGLGRQGVGQGFVDRTASLAIKAECAAWYSRVDALV